MKKLGLAVVLLLFSFTSFSQWHYENSAVTEQKGKNFTIYVNNALNAYNRGNLDQTKYYLKAAKKTKWSGSRYYWLWGKYYYRKGDFGSAKKNWRKGYKKFGCWECKELINKVKSGVKIY